MYSIPNFNQIKKDLLNLSCNSMIKKPNSYSLNKIENVLLTGSTGFLGKYILHSLLTHTDANIYCIIRAKNVLQAKEKLNAKLAEADLTLDHTRIHIILGDFNLKNLGVSDENLQLIEKTIDAIYHCGAFVHHLHTYEILRKDVLATRLLIDLSIRQKQKQFHYISTMNISNSTQDIWKPAINLQDINFCNMGYIQVKWVCEKIIYTYINKGYPFYIYRPGNITGHSITGYTVPWSNHALLLIKGFLQSTIIPQWDDLVEMTPVDLLSTAIVKLSLNANQRSAKTFNLHNSVTLSWVEYIKKVTAFLKSEVEFVEADYWRTKILPQIDRNNSLILFKDFYSIKDNKFNYQPPKDRVTESMLHELGVYFPSKTSYNLLIKIYLEFLLKVNFLRRP